MDLIRQLPIEKKNNYEIEIFHLLKVEQFPQKIQ